MPSQGEERRPRGKQLARTAADWDQEEHGPGCKEIQAKEY